MIFTLMIGTNPNDTSKESEKMIETITIKSMFIFSTHFIKSPLCPP